MSKPIGSPRLMIPLYLGILSVAVYGWWVGGLTQDLLQIAMATVGMIRLWWMTDPKHDLSSDTRRRQQYFLLSALFAGLMIMH